MKLLRRIVRLGVTDELKYQAKREIVTTNSLTLILTGSIFLLMILRNITFPNAPYKVYWAVGMGLFLLPLVLNALFLTTISRLILCYVPVLFIWFSFMSSILQVDVVEQSMFDALRIFLLAVSFIPYLILDRNRPVLLILGVLPTLASFLFFTGIIRLSGVPFEHSSLHTIDYQLMGIRSFVAYLILSTGCFAFQTIISNNDRYNQRLLSEVTKKSGEIEEQNKTLLQKQSELNEVNQRLEELVNIKTRSIKRQNEMLIKYSYTNAHKVRGPVARILGLIQLSRLETDLNFPWFFEKVEEETKGIDKIISSISNELSNVENESAKDSNHDAS
jgi:signal transduction histidine kinase